MTSVGPSLTPPTPPPVPQGNAPADSSVSTTPQDKVAFGQLTQDQLINNQSQNVTQFLEANLSLKDFTAILDSLQADQPNPPPGDANAFSNLSNATGGGAVKLMASTQNATGKNPWFNSTASVAFAMSFQTFMESQMQNELLQGTKIGPEMIMQQASLTHDIADEQMDAAKTQSSMDVAAAIGSGISGAMSLGSAALSMGKLAKAAGGGLKGAIDGMSDSAAMKNLKEGDWKRIDSQISVISGATQGVSSLATMGQKAYESQAVVTKAQAEATTEILKTLLNLAQKRTQDSDSSAQSSRDLYSQFAQTLTQLLEQAVKARNVGLR